MGVILYHLLLNLIYRIIFNIIKTVIDENNK